MSNVSNFFLSEGNETRHILDENTSTRREQRVKKQPIGYFRIEDGESTRVFLLETSFVMIKQHKDWSRHIMHTCRDPKHGKDCYSCVKGIQTQVRTLVPIWNVEQQQIQVLFATNQFIRSLYAFTDEYEDDSMTTPIAISRSGSETETQYSVTPARIRTAERELFKAPKDVGYAKESFLKYVMRVPENDDIRKMLSAAGIK